MVLTAGRTGTGNGTVTYWVDPNMSLKVRKATIAAGGKTLTITQAR